MFIRKMDKKGDERTLTFYWFAIFIIIAVALVAGILVYFNKTMDIREAEAGVMADKIINCISSNGVIKESIENRLIPQDFEVLCGITLKDISNEAYKDRNGEYYITITGLAKDVLKFGNPAGTLDICTPGGAEGNAAKCIVKSVLLLKTGTTAPAVVTIKVAILKVEQNVM